MLDEKDGWEKQQALGVESLTFTETIIQKIEESTQGEQCAQKENQVIKTKKVNNATEIVPQDDTETNPLYEQPNEPVSQIEEQIAPKSVLAKKEKTETRNPNQTRENLLQQDFEDFLAVNIDANDEETPEYTHDVTPQEEKQATPQIQFTPDWGQNEQNQFASIIDDVLSMVGRLSDVDEMSDASAQSEHSQRFRPSVDEQHHDIYQTQRNDQFQKTQQAPNSLISQHHRKEAVDQSNSSEKAFINVIDGNIPQSLGFSGNNKLPSRNPKHSTQKQFFKQ